MANKNGGFGSRFAFLINGRNQPQLDARLAILRFGMNASSKSYVNTP